MELRTKAWSWTFCRLAVTDAAINTFYQELFTDRSGFRVYSVLSIKVSRIWFCAIDTFPDRVDRTYPFRPGVCGHPRIATVYS